MPISPTNKVMKLTLVNEDHGSNAAQSQVPPSLCKHVPRIIHVLNKLLYIWHQESINVGNEEVVVETINLPTVEQRVSANVWINASFRQPAMRSIVLFQYELFRKIVHQWPSPSIFPGNISVGIFHTVIFHKAKNIVGYVIEEEGIIIQSHDPFISDGSQQGPYSYEKKSNHFAIADTFVTSPLFGVIVSDAWWINLPIFTRHFKE
mmetsp:Transcript_41260/g.70625  ORF Transcript_41260/g.70625 Transcript_41260/m.70625 type:complete len:206 (+) Transcript_41260:386-1003(+)